MDILQNDQEGPSDVLLSQGIIVLRGVEIPVMQVGTEGQRRVVSADHFVIPGYSERIIDVYIQRDEDDDHRPDTEFIVEPTNNFQEVYGLRMARTLVDIKTPSYQSDNGSEPVPHNYIHQSGCSGRYGGTKDRKHTVHSR